MAPEITAPEITAPEIMTPERIDSEQKQEEEDEPEEGYSGGANRQPGEKLNKLIDGLYNCKPSHIQNYIEIYDSSGVRLKNFLYTKHRVESKSSSEQNAVISIDNINNIESTESILTKTDSPILLTTYIANLYTIILYYQLFRNNLTIDRLFNNIKDNKLFETTINLNLNYNKIPHANPYINKSYIPFLTLIEYCNNASYWKEIMLTNATLTHLIIHREYLHHLDMNGIIAKYNLLDNISNGSINRSLKRVYNISSNYYTLKYTDAINELNKIFISRYKKIYKYIESNNKLPSILTNEYNFIENIANSKSNPRILQYPDMFNLEIINPEKIISQCSVRFFSDDRRELRKELTNLGTTASKAPGRWLKSTSKGISNSAGFALRKGLGTLRRGSRGGATGEDTQCKVLWTDLIFIYNNKNINTVNGGSKKLKDKKLFNAHLRKIKKKKTQTKKKKTSKRKTLKVIY